MGTIVDYVVYVVASQESWLTEAGTLLSAVAAFASVIVATLALRFSHKQINMHELHNRLMATPHLSPWNRTDPTTRTYFFTIENNGLGPAIIREVKLWVDGELLDGEGPDLIIAAGKKMLGDIPHEQSAELFVVGEFIPPGRKFNVSTVVLHDQDPQPVMAMSKVRVRMIVRYDSILGDAYVYDSDKWREKQG